MTTSRQGHNQVSLKCRAKTPVPGREENGPLVADDYGIAIVARGGWFHTGRPTYFYFFAWSDVIGYRMTSPLVEPMSDEPTTKSHHTELTFYTRRDRHCWELPLSQSQLRTHLGRWLTRIPQSN
jgi:hypothetical protein